jgi:hypothetical protein
VVILWSNSNCRKGIIIANDTNENNMEAILHERLMAT